MIKEHSYPPPRYHWTITHDHIGTDAVGTIGPRGAVLDAETIKKACKGFRMYDADGVLYYEGFICGDFCGFEPLDDFGTPNAGATDIRMRQGPHHGSAKFGVYVSL